MDPRIQRFAQTDVTRIRRLSLAEGAEKILLHVELEQVAFPHGLDVLSERASQAEGVETEGGLTRRGRSCSRSCRAAGRGQRHEKQGGESRTKRTGAQPR